ncbi:MAG TPA: hypothetical protein VNM89_04200 [Solirubrobacterales bacterium]|nr:hypothetical protein [Solirubrobacterales bacterium]
MQGLISTRVLAYVRDHHLGLIAIFIALTGTAYAAQKAPKNSVVAKSIKKGAVTKPKLAPNSVDGSKVVDGSLTGADVNAATLGLVPNASHATRADSATQAGNSDQLGGSAASAYLKGTDSIPSGQLGGTYAAPTLRGAGSGSAGFQTLFAPDACDASSTVSGPSVTVTVPSSGYVEVLARTTFQTVTGNSLSACITVDNLGPNTVMTSTSLSVETRYTQADSNTGTATEDLAQWIPIFTSPGVHTFELNFGRTGANSGTNQVNNRLLLVRSFS